MQAQTNNLYALSPLDGRYHKDMQELQGYFSEAALFRYRVRVEIEYLILLSRVGDITFIPPLPPESQARLRALYTTFTPEYAQEIAEWDRKVNHDVKAVEYWIREQLVKLNLSTYSEAVHFALTSEDVNNLAYALIIQEARNTVLIPALKELHVHVWEMAQAEADTPMLARTHGQPATPTTMGKELAFFVHRLHRVINDLSNLPFTGKLNGATGTFAAHYIAYPSVDWFAFSRAFIRSLNLEPILLTTQIEPHDSIAAFCDTLKRTNTLLLDLCQDIWRYISDDYLLQKPKAEEVGSSTMPHKINPIDFENSEGNLGIANALLEFFSRKLPISRLQRDLSDSTVQRNIGTAFGYSLLSYQRILRGLSRITVNRDKLQRDIQQHPEVLAEAIQTILRREGYPEPYETLKKLTRGHTPTQDDLHTFIDSLDLAPAVREELHALSPESYIGLAPDLARLPLGQ
jgi:adenylosuccinate lyase